MVVPEKRVLWHPHDKNQFIVGGGSQITLYDWSPETLQFEHVTSQHDLQLMKCFAWSPTTFLNDLVAVGYSNGKVDLMRLEATKTARDNILSGGPRVSLPARNSRACNTLAFSLSSPNYLAVGLEKVRAENSLVVWDVETASATLSVSRSSDIGDSSLERPTSSLRFDSRAVHQYGSAENVTCVSFMPESNHLLLAGMSHRWLRLFDLRNPAFAAEVLTKAQYIATDPFDSQRVGCFADGVVTIWDVRRLQHPLLTFTEKDASADGAKPRPNSAFAEIEFSHSRRGTLVTLGRDSSHLRFWDLQQADLVNVTFEGDRTGARDSTQPGKLPRRSWTNPTAILPWSSGSDGQAAPAGSRVVSSDLVLADTRKTKEFSRSLTSFALVPSEGRNSLVSNVMTVNKEGDLELFAMYDVLKGQRWSARGDLSIAFGQSHTVISGFHEEEPPPEPWDIQPVTQSIAPRDGQKHLRDGSVGSKRHRSERPGFGRGDPEGFPALPSGQRESSLSATRHLKSRTYSPSSMRRVPLDRASHAESSVGPDQGLSSPSTGKLAFVMDKITGNNKERERTKTMSIRESYSEVIEDDISMVMRSRVIKSYGLTNPIQNATIVEGDPVMDPGDLHWQSSLAGLWTWINHSTHLFSSDAAKIHGFDFAYQGVLGIWEGLEVSSAEVVTDARQTTPLMDSPLTPSDLAMDLERALSPRSLHHIQHSSRQTQSIGDAVYGDYQAAVSALISRRSIDRAWTSKVKSDKLHRRRLAVALCGWNLSEEDLTLQIKKWESEGKHSRAACWLVFTNHSSRAVDLLLRSNDESHIMVSGMLAALVGQHDSVKLSARQHWEKVIRRMDDPYVRAMLIHVALNSWNEVLREGDLPLRERLAIAFRFLDDADLTTYLRLNKDGLWSVGDIEGLIITGLTPAGMDILQSYVDRTGDVQTAAILSSYVCPSKFQDFRAEKWLEAYRALLDGWKLFHYRCQLDIDRGKILQDAISNGDMAPCEWVPRQILLRCGYCNKVLNPEQAPDGALNPRKRSTVCPTCTRSLPRCVVCLMSLAVVSDSVRNAELLLSSAKDTIDDAVVFCQTCRHGGHASHILDWFFVSDGEPSHRVCPVANCDCRCADE